MVDRGALATKLRARFRGEVQTNCGYVLIGDSVTYNGRSYVVIGFTPMAVIPAELQLRDPETGKVFWVEWPPTMEGVEKAALRLVADRTDRHGAEDAPAQPGSTRS